MYIVGTLYFNGAACIAKSRKFEALSVRQPGERAFTGWLRALFCGKVYPPVGELLISIYIMSQRSKFHVAVFIPKGQV